MLVESKVVMQMIVRSENILLKRIGIKIPASSTIKLTHQITLRLQPSQQQRL